MRRFEVWANCDHHRRDRGNLVVLEFDDSVPDKEIEEACKDACDTLIGNNFDTGWNEIEGVES